jgi:hypothetical protein
LLFSFARRSKRKIEISTLCRAAAATYCTFVGWNQKRLGSRAPPKAVVGVNAMHGSIALRFGEMGAIGPTVALAPYVEAFESLAIFFFKKKLHPTIMEIKLFAGWCFNFFGT